METGLAVRSGVRNWSGAPSPVLAALALQEKGKPWHSLAHASSGNSDFVRNREGLCPSTTVDSFHTILTKIVSSQDFPAHLVFCCCCFFDGPFSSYSLPGQ